VNSKTIQLAFKPLVGLPLQSIGRAANMLWIHFGKMREVPTRKGGKKKVGQWAIHVSCPWRIVHLEKIVVAYHDYYRSPSGKYLEDWDSFGKSQFDCAAKSLNKKFKSVPPKLLSAVADDVNGFTLNLSQDFRLDVFPDDSFKSGNTEHWRLFEPAMETKHFVVP
jgi:hypothetical protein